MRFLLALTLLTLAFTNGQPSPFTELEQARLQSLAYEGAAIDADQRTLDLRRQVWREKVSAFKAAAEKSRPGFAWDAETGKWSPVKP
jgi:hypothetical protein